MSIDHAVIGDREEINLGLQAGRNSKTIKQGTNEII